MAHSGLRTYAEWSTFITNAGISEAAAVTNYAKSFVDNGLTETSLPQLDKDTLVELGVTVIGHRMSLLTAKDKHNAPSTTTTTTTSTAPASGSSTTVTTAPIVSRSSSINANLPTVSSNMTRPSFRKFKVDWTFYKTIVSQAAEQPASHIYYACDDDVQHSIINTHPEFLTFTKDEALKSVEAIVTQRVNPAVHRMSFVSIQQGQQSVQDYIVKLRSAAVECAYACPSCDVDLSNYNIKDQFMRGLADKTLQKEVLAKIETGQLNTLDELVSHAECYKSAIRNQASLQPDPPSSPIVYAAVGDNDNHNSNEQVNGPNSSNNQQRNNNCPPKQNQQRSQQQQQQNRQRQQQQ